MFGLIVVVCRIVDQECMTHQLGLGLVFWLESWGGNQLRDSRGGDMGEFHKDD